MRALTLALGLCCVLPYAVHAQDVPLGAQGQWLLGGSAGGSVSSQTWRQPEGSTVRMYGMDQWNLWLAPRAELFVAKDFAVGAELALGIERWEREDRVEFDSNDFGGALLLAYRVGLGTNAFLLPELSLGAAYHDRDYRLGTSGVFGRGAPGSSYLIWALQQPHTNWLSATSLHAKLFVPFALVLGPNFFAGIGPYVRVVRSSGGATPRGDDWSISLGIATVLGSWL